MINVGHIYFENTTKVLHDVDSKSNIQKVVQFDRNTTRFKVKEMVNPREIHPLGKFVVRLDEQCCDCRKLKKIHLPCSHVLATSKHVHISPHYRLDVVMKVYDHKFDKL
ncbi:hypothetical protein V8G54_010988 [Vigna mungo]|uniref:SWIM-type domain-containing protein n=1 Tax=Vigna mungo TaxID=3915 RepID=A0AAQ3NQD9_VIGMU